MKNVEKKSGSKTAKPKTSTVGKETSLGFDPLSDMGPLGSALDGLDPLSAMAMQSQSATSKGRTSSYGVCKYLSLKHFDLIIN